MKRSIAQNRDGLTLAELLVGITVTALVTAALGGIASAVMDGWTHASHTGDATQEARVVLSRIAHRVETSRQVLTVPDPARNWPTLQEVLLVWEHDGRPEDVNPGEPNFVELVIFALNKQGSKQLLEMKPQVDPGIVVPMDQPDLLVDWIDRFRKGEDIKQPPHTLLDQTQGIYFEVDEYPDPQGIAGLVQQNIRIGLCGSARDQMAVIFFGSANCRYLLEPSN